MGRSRPRGGRRPPRGQSDESAERVPEAAVLVGLVLALPAAVYAVLFGGPVLATALVALSVVYGFGAYAVASADDPAAGLPPDAVLAAAGLLSGVLAGYGLVAGEPAFGLLVAVVAAAPATLYHAAHGEAVNPLSNRATLRVAGGGSVLALVGGALVGAPATGAATAALVAVTAVEYRRQRKGALPPRTERRAVAGCLAGAVAALGASFVVGDPLGGAAVAAVLAVAAVHFGRPGRGRGRR